MALSGSQITRLAVGGGGRAYSGFTPKSFTEIIAQKYRGFISNLNRLGLR